MMEEGEGTSRVGANDDITDDDVLIIGGGGRVGGGAKGDEDMREVTEWVKGIELKESSTSGRGATKEANGEKVCM